MSLQAGRIQNTQQKMRGTINQENKLTDIYLPRKCDYTDRLITSKDHASIQLAINELNEDGTINLAKTNLVTISGFVRSTGQGDMALTRILNENRLI
jgi:small subunit ribosomal protein S21e